MKLVQYYLDGWRAGYQVGVTDAGDARIQPIGPIKGEKPRRITVPDANVREIEPRTKCEES